MSSIAHDAGTVRPDVRPIALADAALLVGRLGLGGVMFAHGAQKVLGRFGGPGLSATVHMFTGMMLIPLPLAYLAIATEFLGIQDAARPVVPGTAALSTRGFAPLVRVREGVKVNFGFGY